jgi:predicted transcriptional regulator
MNAFEIGQPSSYWAARDPFGWPLRRRSSRMLIDEAEDVAARLLHRAGYDLDDAPGPVRIAHGLGVEILRVAPEECWGRGEAARDCDLIYVRAGLAPEELAFTIAHEVMEWHLARAPHPLAHGPQKEAFCDIGAAALLAPRRAFYEDARHHGPDLSRLGRRYGITQSCAALRYGEVTGAPTALVAPMTVRLRGLPWGWPPRAQMRRLACLPAMPGMIRTRLGDDRARVALVAA